MTGEDFVKHNVLFVMQDVLSEHSMDAKDIKIIPTDEWKTLEDDGDFPEEGAAPFTATFDGTEVRGFVKWKTDFGVIRDGNTKKMIVGASAKEIHVHYEEFRERISRIKMASSPSTTDWSLITDDDEEDFEDYDEVECVIGNRKVSVCINGGYTYMDFVRKADISIEYVLYAGGKDATVVTV